MTKLRTILWSVIAALAIVGSAAMIAVLPSRAIDITSEACSRNPDSSACQDLTDDSRLPTIGQNIINTALLIVGVLAVAMIIFAGIRYVTSAGDKQRVGQSKNILIYSIVGLVVAILSYAIVNFVISRF